MAHILNFSIEGLNGRDKSTSYKLDRHVNIFFGPNGSGKTSVLKILNSAMSNDSRTVRSTSFSDAVVEIRSLLYKCNYLATLRKNEPKTRTRRRLTSRTEGAISPTLSQEHQSQINTNEWSWSPEMPESVQAWQHEYLPTSRLYTNYRSNHFPEYAGDDGEVIHTENAHYEDTIDSNFADTLQTLWQIKFGEILSKVRSIQQEALQNIFLAALESDSEVQGKSRVTPATLKALDPIRAYDRMSNFLNRQTDKRSRNALGSREQFTSRYQDNARLRQTVAQIDFVEDEIEEEMRPIEQISELVKNAFSGGKSLSFDGPVIQISAKNKQSIGLEALSSGEKHFVRILLAAIEAQENSLIIDEPELSLHIDWQRKLIRSIRTLNPKCQLIIATHSPEIMADSPDNKIFRI